MNQILRRHTRGLLILVTCLVTTVGCVTSESKEPDPMDDLDYGEGLQDSDGEAGESDAERPGGPGGPAAQKAASPPSIPKAVRERCSPTDREARTQVEIGIMQSIPLDEKGNPKPGVYSGIRCR